MSTIKVNKIENTATSDGGIAIDSSGKVGVGVSTVSDVFHVGGNDAFIRVDRTNGNPGIDLRHSGSSTNRGVIDVTSSGEVRFAAGGSTERCRILAAGGLTFNGDTGQINALDDYEEGAWTPTISGATITGAEGLYTKIGRQVLLQFKVGNLSTSLSAADRAIEGLPFQAANVNQVGVAFIGDVSGVTYSSGYGNIYARINAQGNSLQLLQKKNDGSTHTTAPTLGTGLALRGYAWYTV